MQRNFEIGIEVGKKNFDAINRKPKRWKSRFIPKWIQDNLYVSHYFTELDDGSIKLFIIQFPLLKGEKAHFIEYICEKSPIIFSST